eukprot:5041179-Pleurochrysis_carterae.AAC.7
MRARGGGGCDDAAAGWEQDKTRHAEATGGSDSHWRCGREDHSLRGCRSRARRHGQPPHPEKGGRRALRPMHVFPFWAVGTLHSKVDVESRRASARDAQELVEPRVRALAQPDPVVRETCVACNGGSAPALAVLVDAARVVEHPLNRFKRAALARVGAHVHRERVAHARVGAKRNEQTHALGVAAHRCHVQRRRARRLRQQHRARRRDPHRQPPVERWRAQLGVETAREQAALVQQQQQLAQHRGRGVLRPHGLVQQIGAKKGAAVKLGAKRNKLVHRARIGGARREAERARAEKRVGNAPVGGGRQHVHGVSDVRARGEPEHVLQRESTVGALRQARAGGEQHLERLGVAQLRGVVRGAHASQKR